MKARDFLNTGDFAPSALVELLDLAARFKSGAEVATPLTGKSVALVFFNPSLRTRTSMEVAVGELGGNTVTIEAGKNSWSLEHRDGVVMDGDRSEHIKEAARVLSRYVAAIGVRAFPEMDDYAEVMMDRVVRGFAEYSPVPVLNLESARFHPFQSLADIMTIREKLGDTSRRRVTLTWAYHPKPLPMAVPNSFALICAQFGIDLTIACPEEYELGDDVMYEIEEAASATGAGVRVSHEFRSACEGARIVYAKSWGSRLFYGRPQDDIDLRSRYREWRVDEDVMNSTDEGWFMHCLPVRRNVVVTDGVLDGERNAAIDEAENRLHVQKAVLASIFAE